MAPGWPPCLRIIVAMAQLVKDADKLILGESLTITTPYTLTGVLKQSPSQWLSNARMIPYQTLLLNPARITFQVPSALNPATPLADSDLKAPLHDCPSILVQVHSNRPDVQDTPQTDTEVILSTDATASCGMAEGMWGQQSPPKRK